MDAINLIKFRAFSNRITVGTSPYRIRGKFVARIRLRATRTISIFGRKKGKIESPRGALVLEGNPLEETHFRGDKGTRLLKREETIAPSSPRIRFVARVCKVRAKYSTEERRQGNDSFELPKLQTTRTRTPARSRRPLSKRVVSYSLYRRVIGRWDSVGSRKVGNREGKRPIALTEGPEEYTGRARVSKRTEG